jgi:hypothetical protein
MGGLRDGGVGLAAAGLGEAADVPGPGQVRVERQRLERLRPRIVVR